MGILQTFGVDPVKFVIQMAMYLIPAILATRVLIARGGHQGWLFLIWLVPILGPLLSFFLVRAPTRSTAILTTHPRTLPIPRRWRG
jgi:hypothetical protein